MRLDQAAARSTSPRSSAVIAASGVGYSAIGEEVCRGSMPSAAKAWRGTMRAGDRIGRPEGDALAAWPRRVGECCRRRGRPGPNRSRAPRRPATGAANASTQSHWTTRGGIGGRAVDRIVDLIVGLGVDQRVIGRRRDDLDRECRSCPGDRPGTARASRGDRRRRCRRGRRRAAPSCRRARPRPTGGRRGTQRKDAEQARSDGRWRGSDEGCMADPARCGLRRNGCDPGHEAGVARRAESGLASRKGEAGRLAVGLAGPEHRAREIRVVRRVGEELRLEAAAGIDCRSGGRRGRARRHLIMLPS